MTYNLFLWSCQGFIKYPNSVYSATKACLKVKKKKDWYSCFSYMVLNAKYTGWHVSFYKLNINLYVISLRYIILSLQEASYEGQNSTVTLNSKFYSTYKYLKTTINRLKRVSIKPTATKCFSFTRNMSKIADLK